MDNSVWRPEQLQSGQLNRIRHHFPRSGSNGQEKDAPASVQVLPVLVAIDAMHPANALQPDCLVDSLGRQLNLFSDSTRWKLEINPLSPLVGSAESSLVLVFATASLAGIRLAYSRLKQLPQRPAIRAGVLLAGSHDVDVVRRCHERLATGARQFLKIPVHELGHLAAPGPGFGGDLARLAGQIRDLWYSDQRKRQWR